jgi:hypothetical protein
MMSLLLVPIVMRTLGDALLATAMLIVMMIVVWY